MSKRLRVVSAAALGVIGISVLTTSFYSGGASLDAAGVAETGIDITRYFVWGGVSALVASALLFISASAD